MELPVTIVLASLLGIGPVFLWLLFWLREDNHPEPKLAIFRSFVVGMFAVLAALVIEQSIYKLDLGSNSTIFAWALTEEVLKFFGAWLVALRFKHLIDEPVDVVIYMIAVALGFAALENTLFVFEQLRSSDLTTSLLTNGLRFLGASVLHVVCSAFIGISMAFSLRKPRLIRTIEIALGLFAAILLHHVFNFLIINSIQNHLFGVFGIVWCSAVGIILIIERLRREPPLHATIIRLSRSHFYAKR